MGFGTKVKIFMTRARSGSFRRLFAYTGLAAKEAGRSPVPVFFDVVRWMGHGVGYQDYRVFGFARLTDAQKKTFFTYGHNVAMTRMLNQKDYYRYLNDKCLFLERFGNYLNRDWLDLRAADSKVLRDFCAGKDAIFVKMVDDFGGAGAAKIPVDSKTDYAALLALLTEQRQYLVEDVIRQHPEMNRLCAASVNTVRIVTVTTADGPQVAYALVRIGRGEKAVDNICAGGMYTVVDENGRLNFPAFCDRDACYYETHPVTGTRFAGFQIPYFKEAVELVSRAALEIPELRYIGWDVAITESGPVLVEGNNFPGYDMVQNWRFRPDGIGLLPRMEALAGQPIPRG